MTRAGFTLPGVDVDEYTVKYKDGKREYDPNFASINMLSKVCFNNVSAFAMGLLCSLFTHKFLTCFSADVKCSFGADRASTCNG